MFKMRNFVQPWLNYFPSHSLQKVLDIKRATLKRSQVLDFWPHGKSVRKLLKLYLDKYKTEVKWVSIWHLTKSKVIDLKVSHLIFWTDGGIKTDESNFPFFNLNMLVKSVRKLLKLYLDKYKTEVKWVSIWHLTKSKVIDLKVSHLIFWTDGGIKTGESNFPFFNLNMLVK